MRIAYITAGAAGTICGSCLHDNTLVAALQAQGHDALLLPTYTPIRTDEPDVSSHRVFMGGINVYLQQKSALFRHTPWFLDRLLDWPRLLKWVSRFAVKTRAQDLADLTISVLRGDDGNQRKEIEKLSGWLKDEFRPELIHLTNILLSGLVPHLKRDLKVPILAMLQGDDIFLESLPEDHRRKALELIRKNCAAFDGFVATSAYYADFMAEYAGIPRERIEVIYPGLNLEGHTTKTTPHNGQPFTVGYLARVCPEKGFHLMLEAFRELKRLPGTPPCQLRVSGWKGANQEAFFARCVDQLKQWGLADSFAHVETPDHGSKIRFLQSLDVLSVPTVYREPKGLYVLEALANGVPVVQPRHGSFPELIEATGGGLLVEPNDPAALALAWRRLMDQPILRTELGQAGQRAVHGRFHAAAMAEQTAQFYRKFLA